MTSPELQPETSTYFDRLLPFVQSGVELRDAEGIPAVDLTAQSSGLKANAYYFSHPKWTTDWLAGVHRDRELRERWHAVAGTWDSKVVVDVGCGPGNLFANLGGTPTSLIGVDIALGSLRMAADQGYIPLLADAHAMPLRSQCADVVALNATVHHCDDMHAVLVESARLVRPGGVIVIDHDPQLTAWNYHGVGKLLWEMRKPLYRLMKRGGHSAEDNEQEWAEATEIHHRPGDGLTEEFLRSTLEPMHFDVFIYPHNQTVGSAILEGEMGEKPLKFRVGQRLSGIDPASPRSALSLLCVGVRRDGASAPDAMQ